MKIIDPLNTFCVVCERKITLVDYWVPCEDGIRHARCVPDDLDAA